MGQDWRERFVWGWLRLLLGYLQMSLAAMALGALIITGLHKITLYLAIAATAVTLLSKLLYHGRSGAAPRT
jgi:hypothetical protein